MVPIYDQRGSLGQLSPVIHQIVHEDDVTRLGSILGSRSSDGDITDAVSVIVDISVGKSKTTEVVLRAMVITEEGDDRGRHGGGSKR